MQGCESIVEESVKLIIKVLEYGQSYPYKEVLDMKRYWI